METVKVKSGDTLSGIAKSKGITLRALIAANPKIKNANQIRIGQKINIPETSKIAGSKSDNPYKRMSKTQMSMLSHKNKNKGAQESITRSIRRAVKQGAESRAKDAAKPKGSSDPRGENAAMARKMDKAKNDYKKKKTMLRGRNKSRGK